MLRSAPPRPCPRPQRRASRHAHPRPPHRSRPRGPRRRRRGRRLGAPGARPGPRIGLGPRQLLRARRRQLHDRDRPGDRARRRRRRGRLPGRARSRQPVHPPPGRAGDDGFGARRDPARPVRAGHRAPGCRSGSSRWGSRTTPTPPSSACRRAIDQIRALWAGERLPSATPGLPPIQPMFPPTHRIPIVIAAYRKAFVELAGQKADGYLARPAESIPSLRGILERLRASAEAAGRDPARDRDRRLPAVARRQDPPRGAQPGEARAVRHLHDVGPVRRLAAPGRVRRGAARPDRRGLASRGLHDRRQPHPRRAARRVHALRDARGRRRRRHGVPHAGRAPAAAPPAGPPGGSPDRRADRGRGDLRVHPATGGRAPSRRPSRRRCRRWPASATGVGDPRASPTIAGSASATGWRGAAGRCTRSSGRSRSRRRSSRSSRARRWPGCTSCGTGRRSSPALLGGVFLHAGTNIVNEVYDVRKGIDTITSPRASHAIVKGRISERDGAPRSPDVAFALAVVVGALPGLAARPGDRRARRARADRRLGLHRAAARVQEPRRSASRSCSCSWAR